MAKIEKFEDIQAWQNARQLVKGTFVVDNKKRYE
jgi:hypothetical protein